MATVLKGQTNEVWVNLRSGNAWRGMATGVTTLWFKHLYKFTHSGMEMVGTLFIPLTWMFLFGVCMNAVMAQFNGVGIGYQAYITPGVMLLTSLTAAVFGGSALLSERLNGVINEYLVAPVPRLAILLGTIASSVTKAILQTLVVFGVGCLLDAALVKQPLPVVAGLGVIALFTIGFVGIAAAFAARAKEMEGFHSIILLLNLPLLFVSNALYPLSNLPDTLRVLAYCNPTTYAVDAARHLFYGVPTEIGLWIDVPLLVAFAVGGIWFAYYSFIQSLTISTQLETA